MNALYHQLFFPHRLEKFVNSVWCFWISGFRVRSLHSLQVWPGLSGRKTSPDWSYIHEVVRTLISKFQKPLKSLGAMHSEYRQLIEDTEILGEYQGPFWVCLSLKKVEIGSRMGNIGSLAFDDCTSHISIGNFAFCDFAFRVLPRLTFRPVIS
jgi:hypothetical protein